MLDFTKETFAVFVCSTTGDGVPPNESTAFRDALVENDLVVPDTCSLSVLALGDNAYPHFCRAGAIFDNLFHQNRLLPLVQIDQEDWPVIDAWIHSVSTALTARISNHTVSTLHDYLPSAIQKYASTMHTHQRHTRNNPFEATVISRRLLSTPKSGRDDDKEVVRVEFDITDSGIRYSAGDALAVVPNNNLDHVQRLLLAMASNGDEMVQVRDRNDFLQFEHALLQHLDISTVTAELLVSLRDRSLQSAETTLAEKLLNGQAFSEYGKSYASEREVFDALSDFISARLSAQDLVTVLKPLHARYYSISSTPITSPDTIATTVDVLRYTSLNIQRQGVASTYLQDRVNLNQTKVCIFLTNNPNFRLPKDGTKPIIMIGPGTGIAPFIAFMQERIACDAAGANWIFFGCRHSTQDFVYKEQLLQWSETGVLNLRTAFSRDQLRKIYVQERMRECDRQLWELIEEGAHIYVCGDGRHMAGDVDDTLCKIVEQYGEKSEEEAKEFLESLSQKKRYQRDVWIS